MKTAIHFHHYNWHQQETVWVTGYAWAYGQRLEHQSLADQTLAHTLNFDHFVRWCEALNGAYAIVVKYEGEVWATVGHSWSHPLFYTIDNKRIEIGDVPHKLKTAPPAINTEEPIKSYFLAFGVTPGDTTLLEKVYTIRPGERIRLSGKERESIPYCPFPVTKKTAEIEHSDAVLKRAIDRYAPMLSDRQILLPLTRGYDSRLLACMLKEAGYNNVLCATWGRAGNAEAKTAGNVAAQLGFAFREIEYNPEMIENFCSSKQFESYIGLSGHFTSMPYLQDYFALEYLTSKGIISSSTIALPGHPGDFVRGSHIKPGMEILNWEQMADSIIENFATGVKLTKKQQQDVQRLVMAHFSDGQSAATPLESFEQWDYEERQCKFVANSSQVYNHFGIPHAMPLFDLEIMHHFLALPPEQRMDGHHYQKVAEAIFERNGVAFDLKQNSSQGIASKAIKQMVKAATPGALKKWYYPSDDIIFYREITQQLKAFFSGYRFSEPDPPHRYNAYIVQWYLQWINNQGNENQQSVKD